METWKILLITFVSAIVLGYIFGVIIGKIQVKLMRRKRGALLSRKELLVMAAVFLVGIGCVLFGVLRQNGDGEEITPLPDGMEANPGVIGKGEMPGDAAGIAVFKDDEEAADTDEAGEQEDGAETDEAEDSAEEEATLGTTVKESDNTGTATANAPVAVADQPRGGVAVAVVRPR